MSAETTDENHLPLNDLVRRAIDGDAAALSTLLVIVQPRLRRLASRRLPLDIVRYVDPQDVVQDAMTAAFRNVSSLRTPTFAGFIAWMNAITDRSIAMARRTYRARKRGGTASGELADVVEMDRLMAFLCRNSDSPRSIAGNQEFVRLIRAAMQDLDSKYRTVIALRYIDGLDRKAAAMHMGCTEGSVRMLTLRALRHLRSLLPMGSSSGQGAAG